MKRLPLLLSLLLATLLLLPLRAAAASPEELLASLFDGMPSLAREALPKDPTDAASLSETVGIRRLLENVLAAAEGVLPTLLSSMATLAGTVLLFAVLAEVSAAFGTATARVGAAALGVLLALVAYDRFSGCFANASAFLTDLATLAEAAAPVMSGLYLAGGNTAAALAGSGGMAALSLLLERLGATVLLPLLRIQLGFLLVGAVGEVKTEGMAGTLRNLYATLLGFFSVLIAASVAFGHALGTARDSLTMRSLRFAVGQMLPMVGGTVAGQMGTLAASVSLIRATAGVGCVAAILLTLLPVLVELLLSRFALSLLASLAGLCGAPTAVRLFRGFRSLFDLCLAATAFSSMLFLLLAGLLARAVPAIG